MAKKIIVTGCNGQLGRAVNQFYAGRDDISFVNTDVGELDISNIDAVMALAKEVKPYAIINCAAYTAVDACETNRDLAFKVNTIGARNLSIAAEETAAKLIHVSTDYVFDGTKQGAYYETQPNLLIKVRIQIFFIHDTNQILKIHSHATKSLNTDLHDFS